MMDEAEVKAILRRLFERAVKGELEELPVGTRVFSGGIEKKLPVYLVIRWLMQYPPVLDELIKTLRGAPGAHLYRALQEAYVEDEASGLVDAWRYKQPSDFQA